MVPSTFVRSNGKKGGRKAAAPQRKRQPREEGEEEEISCFSLWKKGSPVFQFRCNLHHPPARPAAAQMEAARWRKKDGGERRDLLEFSARRWKNAAAMGFPMPRQLLPLLTSASPPLLCFGYAFSREERIQCPLLFLRFSLLRRSVVAALLEQVQ
jgi:hypothetical protein